MVRFTLLPFLLLSAGVDAYNRYNSYTPTTLITDIAAIDLDQLVMNEQIQIRKFDKAMKVYTNGGNSGSFAHITLSGLSAAESFEAGDSVVGKSETGTQVTGALKENASWSAGVTNATVEVYYEVLASQKDYVNCQVGGMYTFGEANREGCFHNEGSLTIAGKSFTYSYDSRADNMNSRTVQGLSTNAKTSMKASSSSFYPEFQTFVDYYGKTDYGDHWITSADAGVSTNFPTGNGNSDFSWNTARPGRGEAMKKGAAYLNIWMEVVRLLNKAVESCEIGLENADNFLDQAVATYAGSLTSISGEFGILLMDLAKVRSHQFRTAGHKGDKDTGDSHVNLEIFKEFKSMQTNMETKGVEECAKARESKDVIVKQMKVPLVQGVLRYAYKTEFEYPAETDVIDQERMQDEGATFAAAVLPFVHECGAREAGVVHSNMKLGVKTNFNDVKNAMERTYECMGITCEDVGGIWNSHQLVFITHPCNGGVSGKSPIGKFGTFVGAFGGVLLAGWLVLKFRKGGKRRKNSLPQMMDTGNIAAVSEIS